MAQYVQTIQRFLFDCNVLDKTTGETIDLSWYLNKVSIKENYIENSFPLVVIDATVPEEEKDKIRDDEIQISLNCYRYAYEGDQNQEMNIDTEDVMATDLVFSTILKVYTKPQFTTVTEETSGSETEIKDSDTTNTKVTTPTFNCIIVTIPLEQIRINAPVINQVYVGTVPADAVINMLMENADMDLTMEEPDNKSSQVDMIIPPLNLIPAVRYVQDTYGIYNYGLGIYFDLSEMCYLFSPLKPKESYQNTFTINIEPTSETSDNSSYKACQVEEGTNNVKLTVVNAPQFGSYKKIREDELGITTIFSSYDSSYDLVSRMVTDDASETTDNNKKRYFWNSYNNKFFENSFINTMKSTAEAASIPIKNIDPNYFNPSTKVIIRSSKLDYINGEYAIMEKAYVFSTGDGVHFNDTIALSVTKIAEA